MYKSWFGAVCGVVCFLSAGNAFAVRIDHSRIFLESSGETMSGKIKIDNPDTEDVYLKVYAEDFTYVAPYDGTKDFFPVQPGVPSLAATIDYNPKELTIPAGKSEYVYYSVTPPASVPKVMSAVLFFESAIGKMTSPSGNDVQAVSRVGSLFFLKPNAAEITPELTDFSVKGTALLGHFKNAGNTFISFQGKYYLTDEEGEVYAKDKTLEYYTLPGDAFEFSIPLPVLPKDGVYTMVLTLYLQDSGIAVREIDIKKTGELLTVSEVRE